MVIVTKNQYLLCEKIQHIIMNEQVQYQNYQKGGKTYAKKEYVYDIQIMYLPEGASAHNGGNVSQHDYMHCQVRIRGKVDAYKVYKDLIQQVRESMPDKLFLDKAMENLLTDEDFEIMAEQEKQEDYYNEAEEDLPVPMLMAPRSKKKSKKKTKTKVKKKKRAKR